VVYQGSQATCAVQRLDKYTRPSRFLKPPVEVEKWQLDDGRLLKIYKMTSQQNWSIESLDLHL